MRKQVATNRRMTIEGECARLARYPACCLAMQEDLEAARVQPVQKKKREAERNDRSASKPECLTESGENPRLLEMWDFVLQDRALQ